MLPIITLALLACTASGAQQQLLGSALNLGQSSGSQVYSLGSGQSSSGSQIYSLGSGQSSSGSGLFSLGSGLSSSGSVGQIPVTSQVYTSSVPATSQVYTLNAGGSSLGGVVSSGQSYALNSGSSSGGQAILLGQAPQQAISYTSSAAVAPAFSVVQSNPSVAVGQISAVSAPVQQVYAEHAQVQPGQEIIYRVRTPPKVQRRVVAVGHVHKPTTYVVEKPIHVVAKPQVEVQTQTLPQKRYQQTTVVQKPQQRAVNVNAPVTTSSSKYLLAVPEDQKPKVFFSERVRETVAGAEQKENHKITVLPDGQVQVNGFDSYFVNLGANIPAVSQPTETLGLNGNTESVFHINADDAAAASSSKGDLQHKVEDSDK